MGELELAGIAARLYALPFDDFVAARTAAAKEVAAAAPAKGPAAKEHRSLAADVRSLPKPSVAAWAVNMLAAHQPETLTRARRAGPDHARRPVGPWMRPNSAGWPNSGGSSWPAPSGMPGPSQNSTAGRSAVRSPREVEETLRAATADEGAAAAAQSGRLLRGLSADGVDVVDLAGAVALPPLAVPAAADFSGQAAHARPLDNASDDRGCGPKPTAGRLGKHPAGRPRRRPNRRPQSQRSRGCGRCGRRPATPTPSALERARAAFAEAEESARDSCRGCAPVRAGAGRDNGPGVGTGRHGTQSLKKQLEQTELDLKAARKRQELLTAQAQQAVRAADRARRKEDLARERVLRLGNTPG